MCSSSRAGLLLSLLGLLGLIAFVSCTQSSEYRRIYLGEALTPNGYYKTYNVTWSRCGALCAHSETCFVWSWDSSSWRCQVYNHVRNKENPFEATPTTEVYAQGMEGLFILQSETDSLTWEEAKALCEANNGILGFTSQEKANLLLQMVRKTRLWVGLSRKDATSPWIDLHGNTPAEVYWSSASFEEDDLVALYRFFGNGIIGKLFDASSQAAALCAQV